MSQTDETPRHEAGFDLVPRLSSNERENELWPAFMGLVFEVYSPFNKVRLTPSHIEFLDVDGLVLPFDGQKFLRFYTKIRGISKHGGSERPPSTAGGEPSLSTTEPVPDATTKAQKYIRQVTALAFGAFGTRVRPWDTMSGRQGFYGADAARRSIEAYFKVSTRRAHRFRCLIEEQHKLLEVMAARGRSHMRHRRRSRQGLGVVARLDIPKGGRIVCEKPFLTVPDEFQLSGPLLQELQLRLVAFPKEKQREYFSFFNACSITKNPAGANPLVGIFYTNSLACGSDMGIFTTMSRLTHSCVPNGVCRWNPEEGHMTLHAIRSIQAGEVITIMYMTSAMSSSAGEWPPTMCSTVDQKVLDMVSMTCAVRQQRLMEFGFRCDCPICSLSPFYLNLSDQRRLAMQHNDSTNYGDYGDSTEDGKKCFAACRTLYDLLCEEFGGYQGIAPYVHPVYADAFNICIAHGDEARAGAFAELCYQAIYTCEGDDSPDVDQMRRLSQHPEEASMYLYFGTG